MLGHDRRGISYDKLGRHGEAVADFTRVLELEPGNLTAAYNRAVAFDSMGEFSRAVLDYTRALDMDRRAG